MTDIGVGIIGLGFMGRTHLRAYAAAAAAGYPCRIAAVCDRRSPAGAPASAPAGNLEPAADPLPLDPATRFYDDHARLLQDESVQLVSICTHTETHVDLALAALAAGKHVLVEKPVAIRSADVRRLAATRAAGPGSDPQAYTGAMAKVAAGDRRHVVPAAARLSPRDASSNAAPICMPAMCVRFWPGYTWLKECIDDGTLGRVRSAVFQRLANPPAWSPEFYRDPTRTGGALFDLHIHDADFIYHCFGRPQSVCSTGHTDHLTTLYRFAAGPSDATRAAPLHVVAEGGWDHTPGFAFRMKFLVVFEHATVDFDSSRQPPLLLARAGRCEPVPLPPLTGYDLEVRHMLDIIAGRVAPRATLDEAVAVTEMLEAEAESLRTGMPQVIK